MSVPACALRAYVRAHAENRPGVYRMLSAAGQPLYVGKSVQVRTRLLSHLRVHHGRKAATLIRQTGRIRWEYVPNELSALVREMELIQRWQPRFNVRHKSKPRYGFVKLTREVAPRILPVSRVIPDGSLYFGPFPLVGRLRRTVRELAHTLGLRDCSATTPVFFDDQLDLFPQGSAPLCMRADLGTCLAPCCGATSGDVYSRRVAIARRFLEGRTRDPLTRLERRTEEAARRLDFEYAAILRDRISRFGALQSQLAAFRGRIEGLTFLYRIPGFAGDDRLFLIRRGRIRRDYPYPQSERERNEVTQAVEDVYQSAERGPAALPARQVAEVMLVARWFEHHPGELNRTATPQRWLEEPAIGRQ